MCGIFGIVNGAAKRNGVNGFLRDATVCGVLRGDDSTGLMQVHRKKKSVWVYKRDLAGPVFLDQKRARQLISSADDEWATIGHHRAATHGSVCDENAHPFVFENAERHLVCGVHNGVISGFRRTEKHPKTGEEVTFEVDSEWAFFMLAHYGDEAYRKFNGWYALAYYDSKTDTINLSANGGRSLYYAFVKHSDTMLLASEDGMLAWLASRNHLDIDTIKPVPTDKILSFGRSKLRDVEDRPIPKFQYTAPKPTLPPPASASGRDMEEWRSGHEDWRERRVAAHMAEYQQNQQGIMVPKAALTPVERRDQAQVEIDRAERADALAAAEAVQRRAQAESAFVPDAVNIDKDYASKEDVSYANELSLLGEKVTFQLTEIKDDRADSSNPDGMFFRGWATALSKGAGGVLGVTEVYPAIIRHAEKLEHMQKFKTFVCSIVGVRDTVLPGSKKSEFELLLGKPNGVFTDRGNQVDMAALKDAKSTTKRNNKQQVTVN